MIEEKYFSFVCSWFLGTPHITSTQTMRKYKTQEADGQDFTGKLLNAGLKEANTISKSGTFFLSCLPDKTIELIQVNYISASERG